MPGAGQYVRLSVKTNSRPSSASRDPIPEAHRGSKPPQTKTHPSLPHSPAAPIIPDSRISTTAHTQNLSLNHVSPRCPHGSIRTAPNASTTNHWLGIRSPIPKTEAVRSRRRPLKRHENIIFISRSYGWFVRCGMRFVKNSFRLGEPTHLVSPLKWGCVSARRWERGCRGAGFPLPPGGARGESARGRASAFRAQAKMDCVADACTLREFVGAQHAVPGANAWLGDAHPFRMTTAIDQAGRLGARQSSCGAEVHPALAAKIRALDALVPCGSSLPQCLLFASGPLAAKASQRYPAPLPHAQGFSLRPMQYNACEVRSGVVSGRIPSSAAARVTIACRAQQSLARYGVPVAIWCGISTDSRGHQIRRQDALRLRSGQAGATTERHVVECESSP